MIAAPRPASGLRGRVSIMLLPGPPHELKAMFTRQACPASSGKVPKQVIRTLVMRMAGMAESDLDQLIAPVYKKYANPVTTILAAAGDIQVHLRARCGSEAEAAALLTEVAGPIELLLGDRIYSRNGDSLEAVVGEILRKHHATLAVAESVTGGMLAERITAVPGQFRLLLGGFVTYTKQMKSDLLGVPEETLAQHGAVSKETALAMASGARRRTGATYAIAITGVAGPIERRRAGAARLGIRRAGRCQRLPREPAAVPGRPRPDPDVRDADGAGHASPPLHTGILTLLSQAKTCRAAFISPGSLPDTRRSPSSPRPTPARRAPPSPPRSSSNALRSSAGW